MTNKEIKKQLKKNREQMVNDAIRFLYNNGRYSAMAISVVMRRKFGRVLKALGRL